jgi:hypothetical protein
MLCRTLRAVSLRCVLQPTAMRGDGRDTRLIGEACSPSAVGDVQRPTCGAFGQREPRRRPAIDRDERNRCQRVRSGLHKGFRRPAGRAASLLSMHRRGDGQPPREMQRVTV